MLFFLLAHACTDCHSFSFFNLLHCQYLIASSCYDHFFIPHSGYVCFAVIIRVAYIARAIAFMTMLSSTAPSFIWVWKCQSAMYKSSRSRTCSAMVLSKLMCVVHFVQLAYFRNLIVMARYSYFLIF